MKKQIKINTLIGWYQLTENLLRSIAYFNATGEGLTTLALYQLNVQKYNDALPKGIFNYRAQRVDTNTIEVFADDELILSFTMCTVSELVYNENN